MKMNPKPDYEVGFSTKAGNLFYKDFHGMFYFTFDLDKYQKPPLIILDKIPLTEDIKMIEISNLSQAELSRINLAGERVRQYVISCGYQVKDLPEIRNGLIEDEFE